jgi:hypothetical protein
MTKDMKQFDFEQVGKRMPYNTPDGFFDKFEENVMKKVKGKKEDVRGDSSHKKTLYIVMRALLAVAAAIALFFVVQPFLPKDNTGNFENVELAFNNLSTEDQDFMLQIYEDDDLFINP